MRIAGAGDLETIARLALVEIQHRSAPPMFAPRQDRPLADLIAEHRALREGGAVHLLATLDGHDVGLLTIELTSPVPRLCPDGQPYIGPTATLPAARGQGVGHALVDTALTWAHDHGYQWVSVDFDTANPLSRPFWLHAGFRPAGYGVLRLIDGRPAGQPGSPAATEHRSSRPRRLSCTGYSSRPATTVLRSLAAVVYRRPRSATKARFTAVTRDPPF